MKKILVGGCSFSQQQGSFKNSFNLKNRLWIPWTDILGHSLKDDITVINKAKDSYGQSKIVETILDGLVENDFQVDFVFAQFSAVGRGYSSTLKDFFEVVYERENFHLLPQSEDYTNFDFRDVTNKTKTIENIWYRHSLLQILMLKNILENHNIPYKFFWGWQQINDDIEFDNSDIIKLIYDENFWLYKNHGGMSEYLIDELGKDIAIIPNDFHPSRAGQFYFFRNIISPILKEELDLEISESYLEKMKPIIITGNNII